MNKKILLLQFPKPKNRHSYSPFCLKLESYFKAANIPYENKFTVSLKGSQKKKLPMILDHDELIEDSGLVIEYLKDKHGMDLDRDLSAEQKAVAKAFQWLCEKSLMDIILYFRWVDQSNWHKFREIVFHGAPWFIKMSVANIMSKSIKRTLLKHGLGRFTDSEKLKILDDNLSAISNYLGEKKYFFGEHVSSIDTIIFAFLIQILPRNVVPQFAGHLERYPNLLTYINHFETTYWPEIKSL